MKPVEPSASTKRFAKLLNQPGGITVSEAVRAADINLERIRDSALGEIDRMLEEMYALGPALRTAPTIEILSQLYGFSNSIVGVAGVFGLGHVGTVAYSLCELIDRLRATGRFGASAIQVHLDSLRLMYAASPDDLKQAEAVKIALRRVVDSVPPAGRASS